MHEHPDMKSPAAAPAVEPGAEPAVEPTVGSAADPAVEPRPDPAAQPAGDPALDAAPDPTADPPVDQAIDAAADVAAPDAAASAGSPNATDAAEPAPAAAGGTRAEPTWAETGAALAQRFPALFTPGAPKPIKLRIQADIQQRAPGALTRRQLSVFLHRHTTGTAYLRALVASPQRFDLNGAAAGEVSAEHREAAVAELERRRQIVMERRAAERKARPPAPRLPPAAAPGPRATAPAGPARPTPAPRADRPPPRTAPGSPPRAERPPRPGGPSQRDPRGAHRAPDRPGSKPAATGHAPEPYRAAAAPRPEADPLPDDPARRERALLLRAWEGSPLTLANFCALKGLDRADFEAQIDLARRERTPPRR
jgi:sRNA-binding protein